MGRIAKPPKVKVVFDTNILFTDLDAKLIASGVDRTIRAAQSETGLQIEWILPEIVIRERFRQMHTRACALLEPIRKMEKLIGHNLALSEDILADRVKAVIEREKKELNLFEHRLDYSRVNWEDVAFAASDKKAPFADDKTEKGFKDALILETFLQVVEDSPRSAGSCRVFLVSSDELLYSAAVNRTRSFQNASVHRTLDDLRTQLTAIAAHLSEGDLEKILPEATDLFFTEDDSEKSSIYYSKGVAEKIKALHEFNHHPTPDFRVSKRSITIYEPSFVEKQKQTLFFRTEIAVTLTAERKVWHARSVNSPHPQGSQGLFGFGSATETGLGDRNKKSNAFAQYLAGENFTTEADIGELTVSVHWQASLTAAGKLSKPELLGVETVACSWNSQQPLG